MSTSPAISGPEAMSSSTYLVATIYQEHHLLILENTTEFKNISWFEDLKKKNLRSDLCIFLLSVQLWYLIKGTTYNEAIIQIKTLWKVLRWVCGGHMARSDISSLRKQKTKLICCFSFHSTSDPQGKFLFICKYKYELSDIDFFFFFNHWEKIISNVGLNLLG